jgi:hypothetical protein
MENTILHGLNNLNMEHMLQTSKDPAIEQLREMIQIWENVR